MKKFVKPAVLMKSKSDICVQSVCGIYAYCGNHNNRC